MESAANYAWAFAVIGGPVLLGLVLIIGIVRSRRVPRATREADAPRSYPQRSDREPGDRPSR